MTFLTKPNELKSPTTIKGLILGDTNNGKTTLALSMPDPVLIDFEGGIARVSKQWQSLSMQVKNFGDFLDFLSSKEINQFKTIVIDPIGEMADQIKAYLIDKDPKLGKDPRKLYPAIANEFKKVWTLLKNKNLSIIFVSHTDEVMKDDVESLKIRCEGSFIKGFIPTQVDFVTILRRKDEKGKTIRYLDFKKNDSFTFAKRWAELEEVIEVPTLQANEKNNFLEEEILKRWKEKGEKEEKANQEYDALIEEIKARIASITDLEQLNSYYSTIYNKHDKLWSSYQVEAAFFFSKFKEILLPHILSLKNVSEVNDFYKNQYETFKNVPDTLKEEKVALKTKAEELGCEFDAKTKEFRVKTEKKDGK